MFPAVAYTLTALEVDGLVTGEQGDRADEVAGMARAAEPESLQ
jgi:hypothetical protein